MGLGLGLGHRLRKICKNRCCEIESSAYFVQIVKLLSQKSLMLYDPLKCILHARSIFKVAWSSYDVTTSNCWRGSAESWGGAPAPLAPTFCRHCICRRTNWKSIHGIMVHNWGNNTALKFTYQTGVTNVHNKANMACGNIFGQASQ